MSIERAKVLLQEALTELATPEPVPDPGPTPIPTPPTIRIRPGDNVSAAIHSLDATGGIIKALPGVYEGTIRHIVRTGTKPIYLTSDTANLPKEGERITPDYEPGLAMFQATGSLDGVIVMPNRSSGLYLQGVGIGPCAKDRTAVQIGHDKNNMQTPADRPMDFRFDRVFFKGDPLNGQHLGIRLHGKDIVVLGCWFKDFFEVGRDSQALGGSNGTENVLIENCHIEGGAENLMFGGSDAASPEMRPRLVIIRGNHIVKNLGWMGLSPQPTIKALFELKNIKSCVFERNLLEGNWARDWPDGTAITIKAVNQEGGNPWANCEYVMIRDNFIRNVGHFLTFIGKDDGPYESDWSRFIRVENNVCLPLAQAPWTGTGKAVRMNNVEAGLTFDHNTIFSGRHSFLEMWADLPWRALDWKFTNNAVCESEYGIKGPGAYGKPALDLLMPGGYTFAGNAIRDDTIRSFKYPEGNGLVPVGQWAPSFDAVGRVLPDSPVDLATRGITTDGQRVGADVDRILALLNDHV